MPARWSRWRRWSIVFFGVGISGKAIIIFLLSVFPFIFNAHAGVRAVDRLLINVVRSLGGSEKDLYLKVIVPSVLPYIVAGARIAVGRGLIGVLVGEFFAASEGIGYAIARFGDLFALDKMFACIFSIMVIAVVAHGRHTMGGAGRVPVAGRDNSDERIARTARLSPLGGSCGAPTKSLWQRFEPMLLGTGSIVALLGAVGAAAAPRHDLRRHQAVFHDAEPDRRHAVGDVCHRDDLEAAGGERLRVSL